MCLCYRPVSSDKDEQVHTYIECLSTIVLHTLRYDSLLAGVSETTEIRESE